MTNLSPAQAAVVNADIGKPIQVLASAGSGKTRVLTERIRHIVESTKKDGIIALTFTNKAAEEMQSRLEDLNEVDSRCWIATIHTVAQRVLNQYGHSIGLPSDLHIYDRDQDRKTVFLQSLQENGIDIESFLNESDENTKKNRDKIVQTFMEQFSIVKRELLSEDEIKNKYKTEGEHFYTAFQAYQKSLLESAGIDFDDILVYAHRILLEQPWCAQVYRAKYKHLCVDEAQDLNKAQYEFIKALCGDQIKIMMVGDPNQMIYGFNGSSHRYLCEYFLKDFNPDKFILKENYRSSKVVVRLANKLKPGSQIEADFALDGECSIESHDDENAEAKWICNKIEELLKLKNSPEIEGEISLGNIVVIARNKFVFQTLEELLKENKIPYALKQGERQVEPSSIFGKVFDLAIRLRLNPKDWVDGKKLCAVLKIDVPKVWGGDDLLSKFAADVRKSKIPFPELQAATLVAIQGSNLDQPNFVKMCAEFKIALEALSTADNAAEVERSLLELQEFQRYWKTFRRKGLGESLSAFRNAMALGQLVDDYNLSGLTLSTVHTMKGLERDIVFLMECVRAYFQTIAHSISRKLMKNSIMPLWQLQDREDGFT
jgi:DNA helicase-2/ATP-dependent DNA helicase PcrA